MKEATITQSQKLYPRARWRLVGKYLLLSLVTSKSPTVGYYDTRLDKKTARTIVVRWLYNCLRGLHCCLTSTLYGDCRRLKLKAQLSFSHSRIV
ncbi:hypothetical protein BaRGS_00002894 [Batillaria attramentaria]|uniref:Uncharacterized protein n=1 Tax=Batillaria attramentaria TaxID=370345 RepID=A0ABD0M2Y2_9CAEN